MMDPSWVRPQSSLERLRTGQEPPTPLARPSNRRRGARCDGLMQQRRAPFKACPARLVSALLCRSGSAAVRHFRPLNRRPVCGHRPNSRGPSAFCATHQTSYSQNRLSSPKLDCGHGSIRPFRSSMSAAQFRDTSTSRRRYSGQPRSPRTLAARPCQPSPCRSR